MIFLTTVLSLLVTVLKIKSIKMSVRANFGSSTFTSHRLLFRLKSTSEANEVLPVTQSTSSINPVPVRREYVPRKSLSISDTTVDPTVDSKSVVSNVSSPRIYKPKLSTSKMGEAATSAASKGQLDRPPQQTGSYGGKSGGNAYTPRSSTPIVGRQDSSAAILLSNPQLLIRFRVPREKTEFKKQLEELQSTFAEQADANRASSYSGGYSGGGGGTSRGGGRDAFFDNFAPPSVDFSKRGPTKGKGGSSTGREKESDFEKTKGSKRSVQSGLEDDDIELEDGSEGYDSASMSAVIGDAALEDNEEDYYGEESNFNLQNVPAGALQSMESEGYTLEEMQLSLYGEYGIKVSMNALKRRLQDDKSERKGRKKTGKTRREKNKARNLRFNPVKEQKIDLSEYKLIQVQELAGLMDVGSGELIRHLMINMGVMATMTQSIDVAVAKQLVTAFGKTLAEEEEETSPEEVSPFELYEAHLLLCWQHLLYFLST